MQRVLCWLGFHRGRLNKISTITKRDVQMWYCCTGCGRYFDEWVEFYRP